MKTLALLLVCAGACLVIMTVVDAVLGPRAELLNAWSVVERLLGREPSAGSSIVHRALGSAGEATIVVLANLALGGLVTLVVKLVTRR